MHLHQFCLLVTLAFVAYCITFASAEDVVHDKSLKTNSQRKLTDGSRRNLKGSIDEAADEERGLHPYEQNIGKMPKLKAPTWLKNAAGNLKDFSKKIQSWFKKLWAKLLVLLGLQKKTYADIVKAEIIDLESRVKKLQKKVLNSRLSQARARSRIDVLTNTLEFYRKVLIDGRDIRETAEHIQSMRTRMPRIIADMLKAARKKKKNERMTFYAVGDVLSSTNLHIIISFDHVEATNDITACRTASHEKTEQRVCKKVLDSRILSGVHHS